MLRIGATGPGEAGPIEQALSQDLHNNAGQTNLKRQIPEDYKYDAAALKPLAKMLWSMSVSLGHALSAHKAFVRLKSATISPDGLIGGRGYVMSVKDTRKMLHDACEAMSALCDTVHDEINAPHWQPKLGQLEKADVEKIQDLLNEAQGYLDDPEEMVKEDEEDKDGHAGWHHPAVEKANKSKKEPRSDLPGGGDRETNPQAQPLRHDMRKSPNPQNEKQASVRQGGGDGGPTLSERVAAKFLQSNSSLPVETMPGGPRVDHLDRADEDQTGPYGTYNKDEPVDLHDEWSRTEGFGDDYNYPSDYDNDLHEKQAVDSMIAPMIAEHQPPVDKSQEDEDDFLKQADEWATLATSAFPDSNSDKTPTEAWDFGIGDGNGDQATGQGAGGYGEGNPGAPDSNPGGGTGNRGVYGPQSGLPKDPGGKVNPDEGDSNGTIENEIGGKGRYAFGIGPFVTYAPVGVYAGMEAPPRGDPWAVTNKLPGTSPFAAPDFQEATREEPPGVVKEAYVDGVYGGADPWAAPEVVQLDAMPKQAWYDGVYDFERPVDPVGGSTMPAGPQEPYVGMFMEPEENFDYGGVLPGDGDAAGVARTDYFVEGPKPQNMDDVAPSNVGATRLPGEQMPAKLTPTTQRPSHNQEFMFGTGELPGDGTSVTYDYDKDLGPDQTTRYEQQNTPYIQWDDNTPEMRPDPVHQRDPVQGPYVHNDLTERPSNG